MALNQEVCMRKLSMLLILVLLPVLFSGCGQTVKRTDVNTTIDLSGRWNDADARMVADEMLNDCLARPWLNEFNIKASKAPVVIVGTILNRSMEHIDSKVFTSDLERNLLNSGKVKFVATKDARSEVRDERDDQQINSSKATINTLRQETGADFMLQGTINAIKDEIKGKYVIMYQVNLELISMANNEKVWIGQKEIKKVVAKSAYSL
jgi:penicillin-binding protein activator